LLVLSRATSGAIGAIDPELLAAAFVERRAGGDGSADGVWAVSAAIVGKIPSA
jgi:hypothetical protein